MSSADVPESATLADRIVAIDDLPLDERADLLEAVDAEIASELAALEEV